VLCLNSSKSNKLYSAKYIEGLENRLKRMESLLDKSGLLDEGDNGRTDLAMLEKRLASKSHGSQRGPSTGRSEPSPVDHERSSPDGDESMQHGTDTPTHETTIGSGHSSPNTTPEPTVTGKEKEVEALSDMMCSLVTNSCGETRFIGKYNARHPLLNLADKQ
jgi:hypothetical protein